MEALQSWVSKHKLTSVGTLWATTMGASYAYNSGPKTKVAAVLMKPSLKLIHARIHAQAFTLALLSGSAAYHYYFDNSNRS